MGDQYLNGDNAEVELPMVDMISRLDDQSGYGVMFIPSDLISEEEKESVRINEGSKCYSNVLSLMTEIEAFIVKGSRLDRISHLGGIDFSFLTSGGQSRRLSSMRSADDVRQISRCMKQIAKFAEQEFEATRLIPR